MAPPRKHETDVILDAARALVLDGGPRSATVTTIEPSRLLVLSDVRFRQVFRDSSRLSARVLPEVARRLAA